MASKKQVKNVKAMETATRSQKTCNGLQKLGRDECRIPVRFKLVTPDAADPALITAYANTCSNNNNKSHDHSFIHYIIYVCIYICVHVDVPDLQQK